MPNNGSYSPGNRQINNNTQQEAYPRSNSYPSNNYPQGLYPSRNTYPQPLYQQSQQPGIWNWYKRQKKGTKIGIGGGMICLVLLLYVYFLSTIIGSDASAIPLTITPTATEIDTGVSGLAQALTPTQAQPSSSVPTSNPTVVSASQLAQSPTPMVLPTQATVLQPSQVSAPSQATVSQPSQVSAPSQATVSQPSQETVPQPTRLPFQSKPSTTVPTASSTQPPAIAPTIFPTQSSLPVQLPTPDSTTVPIVSSTPQLTSSPVPPTTQPESAPLFIIITNVSAIDNSSGFVSVHTLPGAVLTIKITYCSGDSATSANLQGTISANSAGDYTWSWIPATTCRGTATVSVTASLNGQTANNSESFIVH